jgi:diguanylate cyclase (GGDEF)-like protein
MAHPSSSSLSTQLAHRITLAVISVAVLFTAGVWALWTYESRRESQQHGDIERSATLARMADLEKVWQYQVAALAESINYQRLLEAPGSDRWVRLRDYLGSFSENQPHSRLLVLDMNDRVVFGLGQEAQAYPLGQSLPPNLDWHSGQINPRLHRMLRAPLWLGADGGNGSLVGLRPLDNSVMRNLSSPAAHAHLTVNQEVSASVLGDSVVGAHPNYPDLSMHLSHAGNLCMDYPIAEGVGRLHVEVIDTTAVSPWLFTGGGAAIALALLTALYLSVGTWARQTLGRVRALNGAAQAFDARQRLDGTVDTALNQSLGAHDEIGTLRQSLQALMQGAETRAAESRAYLETLDTLEEAVVEVDRGLHVVRASSALTRLMHSDCSARRLPECFHADDRDALETELERLFAGDSTQLSLRLRTAHGAHAENWLETRFVPVDQPVTRVRGVLRDITQTYLQEKHITHMALHDALTGLPNRVLLEDRAAIAILQASRQTRRVGLGFIDLDHFKHINDSMGHKIGDKVLVAFAHRVSAALRGGDTLCRWGGDEFVVLLPDIENMESARETAHKIALLCREPLLVEQNEFAITFSMGFAVYPDDSDNVDTLLSQADRAMFHAKSQGRNNVQFFSEMGKKDLGKKMLYIQTRLAQAIHDHRIQTHFQPVVAAGSRRVVAVEALARWHEEELGWVPPSSFIPMAENLGLVRELGDLVWQAALTQHALWQRHGLHMAVNLSNRQLFMPYFAEKLVADVRKHGLTTSDIILEVTESVALLDVEYAAERLHELSAAGFRIAVDDFGTGYSSLSQLHAMPVHELKIDIAFVRRIHESTGRRLVQAIVHMAEALDLVSVAEGVEDEATAKALEEIGVQRMQGYLFARPMSAQDASALLDEEAAVSHPPC